MSFLLLCLLGAAPVLAEMPPEELDGYLKTLHAGQADFPGRLAQVARDSVGTPYFLGPLGEGPGAAHDNDPLMDLSRVDCVTFVEQAVALAAAPPGYEAAFALLQRIRYAGGAIDFETRNHFMVADWIPNNPWSRDVTRELGAETAPLTRTISRSAFFRLVEAPEVGQDTPDRDITLHYLPSARVAAVEAALPSPALIMFIGKVDWLFALHCGLYLRDEAGDGLLYHASSQEGAVVAVPLGAYLAEQGERFLGITVYALDEPAWD